MKRSFSPSIESTDAKRARLIADVGNFRTWLPESLSTIVLDYIGDYRTEDINGREIWYSNIEPQPDFYNVRVLDVFTSITLTIQSNFNRDYSLDVKNGYNLVRGNIEKITGHVILAGYTSKRIIGSETSSLFMSTPLTYIDAELWDMSGVINADMMFKNCKLGKLNVDSWKVSALRKANSMFEGNVNIEMNVTNWDVSNLIESRDMFRNCFMFNSDLSDWALKASAIEHLQTQMRRCQLICGLSDIRKRIRELRQRENTSLQTLFQCDDE